MTVEQLQAELDRLDDGVLRKGAHQPGREFCALEFESQVRGRAWSDSPRTLPDLRPLNDAKWSSDAARTEALLPVMSALWDWASWPEARRCAWADRVIMETVQQIISALPNLPEQIVAQCRAVTTRDEARIAASAADAYAAYAAAYAYAAAIAANAADADTVLRRVCAIWIAAAKETV